MKAATKQGLSYPSKAMNIKQKKAVAEIPALIEKMALLYGER